MWALLLKLLDLMVTLIIKRVTRPKSVNKIQNTEMVCPQAPASVATPPVVAPASTPVPPKWQPSSKWTEEDEKNFQRILRGE